MHELFSLIFRSPSLRELSAFPLHTGVIAAVHVQAGASLLIKRVCETDPKGLSLLGL